MAEQEWKISKSGAVCSCCNAPLSVGASSFSALLQSPEGLQRKDFCSTCFQANRPQDVYYFWKHNPVDPGVEEARRQPVVDIDYVFDFFKRLDGDSAPQKLAFRFILALMLARKKLLVAEGKKTDSTGGTVHVFRERRGGERHDVFEPALSEEEISGVSGELGTLLGLAPPAAPAPAPVPPAAQP